MNLRLRKVSEPALDLNKLEEHIRYAPPAIRAEEIDPTQQITSFGALPTKELDEIVAAAEAEIAHLKNDAQIVRDMYVKHTQRIAEDIKRLREGVRLSMETMKQLREQCIKLDKPLEEVMEEEKKDLTE